MTAAIDLEVEPRSGPVVVLSDLHLEQMAPDKLDRLVGFLRERFAPGTPLVVLGDLADGLHKPETRARLEHSARELLATFAGFRGPAGPVPLYIPGNHDSHFRTLPMDWGALPLSCVGGRTPIYIRVHGRVIRLSHGDEYDPGTGLYRHTDINHRSKVMLGMFELERRWWRAMGRWSESRGGNDVLRWLAAISDTPVPRPVFATLGWEIVARRLLARERVDAVMMGHTHAPRLVRCRHGCYVNTGDWLQHAVVTWLDDRGVHQQDLSRPEAQRTVAW